MEKKFSVLEISAFELVAVNTPDSKQNACNRQSKCEPTVLRPQI